MSLIRKHIASAIMYMTAWGWLIINFIAKDGQTGVTVCPSRLFLGIPCAGCGTTRATVLFFKGHWAEAFTTNPNMMLYVAFLSAYPLLLLAEAISGKDYLQTTTNLYDQLFSNRCFVIIFIIVEVALTIRNNIIGI